MSAAHPRGAKMNAGVPVLVQAALFSSVGARRQVVPAPSASALACGVPPKFLLVHVHMCFVSNNADQRTDELHSWHPVHVHL